MAGRGLVTAWTCLILTRWPVLAQELGNVEKFEAELKAAALAPASEQQGPAPGTAWMEPYPLTNISAVGFVLARVYRLSRTRFVVLGLSPAALLTTEGLSSGSSPFSQVQCSWTSQGNGLSRTGKMHVGAQFSLGPPYVHSVYLCDVPAFSPTPSGILSWLASFWGGVDPYQAEPGVLRMKIGPVEIQAYEQPEPIELHQVRSPGPFPHSLVFCSAPLFGALEPASITQWIQYHLFVAGFDRLVFYNAGGITPEMAATHLRPFLRSRVLTLVNWTEQEDYPSWYHGQSLAIHDCLFRSRETAQWVSYGDLDEYIDLALHPPRPLKALLQESQARPWVSRGTFEYARECEGGLWEHPEKGFAVERIAMRDAKGYCFQDGANDVCPSDWGRRKVIVNPRKVLRVGGHSVEQLAPGVFLPGLDLRVSDQMRNGHFRGLTGTGEFCLPGQVNLTGLARDASIAAAAAKARACALTGSVSMYNCKQ